MATSTFSIVKIKGEKRLQISYITAQKKYVQCSVNDEQLSLALLATKQESIDSLKNVEVEFEEENGQPVKVREKGKEWDRPDPSIENIPKSQPHPQNVSTEYFHNPYNFVPAVPRDDAENTELGDRNPLKIGMGHGVYQRDRWSGRIAVTLKTKTPLLIPDIFDDESEGHKTYPLRIGADGKPYLPPTSIKGMLRSAYEAVTNSRLGVFEEHSDRLAYRMEAKEIGLIPARVKKNESGKLYLHLMQAVKLPRYPNALLCENSNVQDPTRPSRRSIPQHGELVWVKYNGKKMATQIQKRDLDSFDCPASDWKEGWVWIANHNIKGKKNERVFIESDDFDDIPIDKALKSMWQELIQNYKDEHEKELKKREKNGVAFDTYLGEEPNQPAFSRHIYEPNSEILKEGTLCYVELDENEEVKSLLPVTVSRNLHKTAPISILDQSLKPAAKIDELSPADRVFGWVNQNGKGAYKGNLRIHSVKCLSSESKAIDDFGGKVLPLAILGQPKPQQARFYVAKDKVGSPLEDKINKQDGYGLKAKGLRGRKVYPHHNLPMDDREYSQAERSDQNRSIRAWVNSETEFRFEIDVTNLSDVELGALLWLLSLPENSYHRLGGGKPYGFGSVALSIDWVNTDLRQGSVWKEFYSDLSLGAKPYPKESEKTIAFFQNEVAKVYGRGKWENVTFIKAFEKAARGFDDGKPIHYPRLSKEQGESFKWFVENERVGGQKISLPMLVDDRGLPLNPQG